MEFVNSWKNMKFSSLGSIWAWIFFLTITILMTLLLFPLFVATSSLKCNWDMSQNFFIFTHCFDTIFEFGKETHIPCVSDSRFCRVFCYKFMTRLLQSEELWIVKSYRTLDYGYKQTHKNTHGRLKGWLVYHLGVSYKVYQGKCLVIPIYFGFRLTIQLWVRDKILEISPCYYMQLWQSLTSL